MSLRWTLLVLLLCGCSSVREFHARPLKAPDGSTVFDRPFTLLPPEQAQHLYWKPRRPEFLSKEDFEEILKIVSRLPGLYSYRIDGIRREKGVVKVMVDGVIMQFEKSGATWNVKEGVGAYAF